MAVFTCAETIEACLAGQEAGWKHFVTHYLPLGGLLLDRHYPGLAGRREAALKEVLLRTRDQDAQFFRDYRGHSEREFLLHLREHALRVFEEIEPAATAPPSPLPWETFEQAFSGLTSLERQVMWMFLLCPTARDTPLMLRADESSVSRILSRAQELLRSALDRWSADILEQNRHLLAGQARLRATAECPQPRAFLRLLDGQNTWRDRYDLEDHLERCWRCVDYLCRFREVYHLSRLLQPFSPAEAEPFLRALGLRAAPPARWRRLLGAG